MTDERRIFHLQEIPSKIIVLLPFVIVFFSSDGFLCWGLWIWLHVPQEASKQYSGWSTLISGHFYCNLWVLCKHDLEPFILQFLPQLQQIPMNPLMHATMTNFLGLTWEICTVWSGWRTLTWLVTGSNFKLKDWPFPLCISIIQWLHFGHQTNLDTETLLKQFEIVKQETNRSHVMKYGDMVCTYSTAAGRSHNETVVARQSNPARSAVYSNHLQKYGL